MRRQEDEPPQLGQEKPSAHRKVARYPWQVGSSGKADWSSGRVAGQGMLVTRAMIVVVD